MFRILLNYFICVSLDRSLTDSNFTMKFTFPGEKLLYPAYYGPEEYLVVGLALFVVFVAIKHLVYHTLYFWWYCYGQFYIPNKCWSFITGTSLSQRVLKYVSSKAGDRNGISVDKLLTTMDCYFKTKEFAPSLSTVKGKVLEEVLTECKPKEVLVVGCHVGYVLLQMLRSLPKDARIITIESNQEFIVTSTSLLKLAGLQNQVTFVCAEPTKDTLERIRSDYGTQKFDFVFLNRTKHGLPSYVPFIKLLEGDDEKNDGFLHRSPRSDEVHRSVLLADKVVMPGDPEFLKYVRLSEKYETKYYQMSLEHTSDEIVDGMEKVVFVG